MALERNGHDGGHPNWQFGQVLRVVHVAGNEVLGRDEVAELTAKEPHGGRADVESADDVVAREDEPQDFPPNAAPNAVDCRGGWVEAKAHLVGNLGSSSRHAFDY